MKEIDAIRQQILDFFDAGDAAALDRLYLVLNKVIAEISVKRALLGLPEPKPEPEPEERLEMVNQERLDREGFE
ncbi:MAG TPA: hypothetical protein VLR50_13960 [Desulfobacterales bacterium]|nr:hypothetical protein [Desulfobacterales bacterium]